MSRGTAQRQQRARGRIVQRCRIIGRKPVGVDQPTIRRALAACQTVTNLSLRHDARADVKDDRKRLARGGAEGKRVGRQPPLSTAERGDPLPGASAVGRDQSNHARGGCHLDVRSQPPRMVCVTNHNGSQRCVARLADRKLHRVVTGDLSKNPAGVDPRSAVPFFEQLDLRTGHDVAVFDLLHVLNDPHHAVRIVSGQVGVHQMPGNDASIAAGDTGPAANVGNELLQLGRLNRGHTSSLPRAVPSASIALTLVGV